MRVSTGMIFDAGVASINRQTASLLHTQQQVASGRRILTPSDDPVAAARALEVTQASDVVAQFKQNQDYATSALGLEETYLTSTGGILARARELAVLGGNSSLSVSDRKSIATELRMHFDALLNIANSTDGTGNHIFGGFMSSTTPFGGSVDNILAGNEIAYQGDDGQRKLQVSPNRFIEVSNSGSDVFRRIRNGNGDFVTGYTAGNTGTGVIDSGSVTNQASWNAATTKNIEVRMTITAGVTSYDLVDTASGDSLLTGAAAPAPLVSQRLFQPGQPIVLQSQGAEPAFDLGASLAITGDPATGDSFSIVPSSSQSIFATLSKLIGALEAPGASPVANTKLSNEIGFAVTNIDKASDNILRVRAQVGSRMNEVDSIANLTQDLELQYQQTLSELQDIDYAKTITDLTRKQTNLEAAQLSFAKISQLSLFNYLR
ncbi:MAG: flagellar hook-associated protein FlgL [Burkholderiaceae bacterium]|nr:flagellar hook-associated protein FlgL [Burkholderiaceae bacterium]